MQWSDQLRRIRRMLRDPDGNIWDDSLLLGLYNDAQRDLQNKVYQLEKVTAIQIPPQYAGSYQHDWEYAFTDHEDGEVYQRGYRFGEFVCDHPWEAEFLAGATSDGSYSGWSYEHPWEAWYASTPSPIPSLWAPEDFNAVVFLAWDRKPILPVTLREIQRQDGSWKSRTGQPQYYWRDDTAGNRITVYPMPSDVTWTETAPDNADSTNSVNEGFGIVLYTDADDPDSEYGVSVMEDDRFNYADTGAIVDSIDADENLIMVYRATPHDLDGSGQDESEFPPFLRKYIEYQVLENAYLANTDGNIKSLADYWGWRKQIAWKTVKQYRSNTRVDRDYRLTTRGASVRSTRQHPRLPDAYPPQRL